MKNVLEMLEASECLYPNKTVFSDSERSYTYSEFAETARRIGGKLLHEHGGSPVAVLMQRGADCLAAMFGVIYSGVPYAVLDCDMPADRIDSILETLCAKAIIADSACREKAETLRFGGRTVSFEDAISANAEYTALQSIREGMTESDILYVLFTSGSTGRPKGCAVSHRNVLAYSRWFTRAFNINESTVFGSQTPFYFSMSVSDVYATVRCGASMQIIEKKYFAFPIKLAELLNERQINTVYWVPSALCLMANWKIFDYVMPSYLTKVLFAGEVMPVKQLNYWIKKLPDAVFANLFGPTETTDICTYYTVEREFCDSDTLPIGKACDNCNVFIADENGRLCNSGEEGELYVRGPFVAAGYYNDPEKTAAAFVQNPLNSAYPETVYRTGDIVRVNGRGEIEYVSRRDHQIKRMGYRIELGEIEAAATAADGVGSAVCIWNDSSEKLILVYEGKTDAENVRSAVSTKVPAYMLPDSYEKIRQMPYNQNGKIDRKALKERFGI